MQIWMLGGKIHSGKNLAAKIAKDWLESNGLKVDCEMLAKGVKDGCKRDFAVLASYLNELSAEAKRSGNDTLADLLKIKDLHSAEPSAKMELFFELLDGGRDAARRPYAAVPDWHFLPGTVWDIFFVEFLSLCHDNSSNYFLFWFAVAFFLIVIIIDNEHDVQ